VASALPEYRYSQEVNTAALKHHWNGSLPRSELLDRLHTRAGVEYRHLAFPLERYARFENWGETNAAWLEVAQTLSSRAIDGALERCAREPERSISYVRHGESSVCKQSPDSGPAQPAARSTR
jgi:alkylresorcinol/alkylpyrone synthase